MFVYNRFNAYLKNITDLSQQWVMSVMGFTWPIEWSTELSTNNHGSNCS